MGTWKGAAKPGETAAGKRAAGKAVVKTARKAIDKGDGAKGAATKATAPEPPARAAAAATRRPPVPKAASAKPVQQSAVAAASTPPQAEVPVAEARYRWIAHAAYLRAEKRGFVPGHEVDDWLAAEADFRAAFGLPQD